MTERKLLTKVFGSEKGQTQVIFGLVGAVFAIGSLVWQLKRGNELENPEQRLLQDSQIVEKEIVQSQLPDSSQEVRDVKN